MLEAPRAEKALGPEFQYFSSLTTQNCFPSPRPRFTSRVVTDLAVSASTLRLRAAKRATPSSVAPARQAERLSCARVEASCSVVHGPLDATLSARRRSGSTGSA